ncbi:ParB N-terminal domain-containing protein [uncultured Paludibaculum sp.]|uniref:ParB/RepB/Spo0J family partition protein n=1 Tax=uncultured Paludibaculum sp. TaxID=1765020 RepID=UPI002AAC3883|nr:ParB N-terminal domain-containing protein [uncultured Paludibaculum sp.]
MARALNADVDARRGDLLRMWPEDLIVNPAKRGRFIPPTQEEVEEKLASILELGQLQPCPVTITFDRRVELAAGFTRWEAFMLWNSRQTDPKLRRRIELKVIDANPEESFLANIAENRMRNATTVIDDAHNIRRLARDFSKTDAEICAIYAERGKPMSSGWLDNMRLLTSLPREQQEAIHRGHLNATTGYLLAQMDPAKREEVLKEAKEAGEGKVTTAGVVKAARKQKALRASPSLRTPELNATFRYLKDKDKNPRVKQLAGAYLDYQAGKLTEPDFFGAVHALFS